MENENKKVIGLLKQKLNYWVGIDFCGICLYSEKPKLVKTKSKHNEIGYYFESEYDCIELEEFFYEKVSDDLKRNPRLYKVRLREISLEEIND